MKKLTVKQGQNGKYGFVDNSGKWIIEPKFDEAESFRYKIAKVKIDGKYGFIRTDGSYLFKPELRNAFMWGELGVAHFDKDEDGNECDGWAYFNCKKLLAYITEEGLFDKISKPEDRDADYLEAWNCAGYYRIYKDGECKDSEELKLDDEDDECEDPEWKDPDDWEEEE